MNNLKWVNVGKKTQLDLLFKCFTSAECIIDNIDKTDKINKVDKIDKIS